MPEGEREGTQGTEVMHPSEETVIPGEVQKTPPPGFFFRWGKAALSVLPELKSGGICPPFLYYRSDFPGKWRPFYIMAVFSGRQSPLV